MKNHLFYPQTIPSSYCSTDEKPPSFFEVPKPSPIQLGYSKNGRLLPGDLQSDCTKGKRWKRSRDKSRPGIYKVAGYRQKIEKTYGKIWKTHAVHRKWFILYICVCMHKCWIFRIYVNLLWGHNRFCWWHVQGPPTTGTPVFISFWYTFHTAGGCQLRQKTSPNTWTVGQCVLLFTHHPENQVTPPDDLYLLLQCSLHCTWLPDCFIVKTMVRCKP